MTKTETINATIDEINALLGVIHSDFVGMLYKQHSHSYFSEKKKLEMLNELLCKLCMQMFNKTWNFRLSSLSYEAVRDARRLVNGWSKQYQKNQKIAYMKALYSSHEITDESLKTLLKDADKWMLN